MLLSMRPMLLAVALTLVGWTASLWAATDAPPLAETRTTLYHADHVGSVRAETDETGAAQVRYRYESFGLVVLGDATLARESPRFGGKLRDAATELDDFHARHY